MSDRRPGRVLVIEDEPDVASLVRLNLEMSGLEVRTAPDGQAGLEAAAAWHPDLILLDVMMPVLDGWQVLAQLKDDDDLQDIPVVMLTALADERAVIRGHLQGAIRYVTKPFSVEQLMETVETAMAPVNDAERERRRARVSELLHRLAELEAGRENGQQMRLSRLERPPQPMTPPRLNAANYERLRSLTGHQQAIAIGFAEGSTAGELARELGVSRSSVYATRKRIARKLGVPVEDVGEAAGRFGLTEPDDDG